MDGGVRYRLEPWPERHAIRVIESYDAASETARAAERSAHGRSLAKRQLAIVFSPLLGHLPGEVQHRMETEFSAPARWMTVVSAIPVFAWAFLGLMNVFFTLAGAPEAFPWAPPPFFAAYLAVESAVRIGSAWIGGRPMGSLAGVVVWWAVQAALGRKRPPAAAPAARPSVTAEEAATDRYRILEPLLALLPARDQSEIERRFGFEVRRWGRVSVAVLLFVGAANVLASLLAFAGKAATAADAVWLAAGLAICAEQLARRASLARGTPRGSVLGVLVRPFAEPLLHPPGPTRR